MRNQFKIIPSFLRDPVSKTAIILMSTWCMNAAAGFLFIFIAAKMYTIDSLGIATVLISYASIIILITRFGTEQSLIRYYDDNEKSSIFYSSIFLTTIPAIIIGFFLVTFADSGIFNPILHLTNPVIFLISIIILSVSWVSAAFLLSSGKPIHYLLQSSIINSRFLLLLFLIPFGAIGIFSSLIIATGLSAIFALIVLFHTGVKFQLPEKKFIVDTFHYSLGNYLSDFCVAAPVFLIPILVFFLLGQKETAQYSVSYAVASVTFLIPTAIGYALFISGCQKKITIRSMKTQISATFFLLLGLIILFFFIGKYIVSFLGPDYSGTEGLILIIMLSSIFALLFQVFSAEFKIFRHVRKLLLLNFVFFVTLMSLSYLFCVNLGLQGAGYAWTVAYAVCVVPVVCYRVFSRRHIFSNNPSP